MLVIRLARTGRNKYPTYRIVSAESARAATGKHIDVLGHYNPHTKELVLDKEAITKRLSQGAQPSNTVVKLLLREKMELPKWVVLKTKAAKAAPVAEEVAEAPAEADTEVTEAEAAAEADETLVGEVAEDAAADAGDDVPNSDDTETAASEEAAATDAADADDTAADAAEAKPAE